MNEAGKAAAGADLSTRYITLDALRGFAVMGILAMNIVAFAMPEMAYINPNVYGDESQADIFSWILGFVLVDGKMRGLFSLLFGASMMLIVERTQAKGESPASTHFRRMGWLALFGLAHFFFIWFGDILFLYAAVGCVAYLFKDMEARSLIKIALIFYAIGFLLFTLFMGSIYLLAAAASGANPDPEMAKQYQELLAEFSGDAPGQVALYQGGYLSIVGYKFKELFFYPFGAVIQNILETLPFMMIGMALLKNGFMTGMLDRPLYRKWATIGIVLGGAGYAALAWLDWRSGFDPVLVMNVALAWTMPFRLLMTIGYAAALVMLISAFSESGFIARVAATGRAAFTNYLGTSIVMTTIFYGYGLGLYGKVGRTELWLYVLGAWLVMLLWSKPWLVRFHYGPLEWLWRSLARWEIQPLRR
ncbi:MAG: DUF418 domain-containing protein [Sphingorhabdus sp.]